jgi:hypothetical protein
MMTRGTGINKQQSGRSESVGVRRAGVSVISPHLSPSGVPGILLGHQGSKRSSRVLWCSSAFGCAKASAIEVSPETSARSFWK